MTDLAQRKVGEIAPVRLIIKTNSTNSLTGRLLKHILSSLLREC